MATRTLLWSPDTCDCQLTITYDDTTPQDTRTYTPTIFNNTCSFHASQPDIATKHAVLSEENQRKNNAQAIIVDNAPSTMVDTRPTDGTKQLKKGISINFTLTGTAPNRIVNLSVSGITLNNQQKNAIQNFLDNKFGVGRVILS